MKSRLVFVAVVMAFALTTAANTATTPREPLYDGLGTYSRKVTTVSPEAQRYFNQGLAFLQGFNHGAAIRAFQEAARIDPECAMAHWGIALACGPHINFPVVPPPAAELAWKELALARQYSLDETQVERDLIEALGHRYANPQPEDRSPLDSAYASAMRDVWRAHRNDPDVGAFFAESLMDLRPWDQWTREGQPEPGTDEILATLDAVLKLDIHHPFANHLYIHAVEASPNPERAKAAADRLANLQPGLAHNVHMPSHIYIRMGLWHDAIVANEKAIAADKRYREVFGEPKGFLPVYVAHNQHMLAYAAMMTGQKDLALEHIRALLLGLPSAFLDEYGSMAEVFFAMPLEVMIRFGMWDEILSEPPQPDTRPFSFAFRHAARGIAYAAKGDVASARREQATYLEAVKRVPPDEIAAGNNKAQALVAVVTPMLDGEILFRDGKVDEGLAQLRAAVKAEDALRYDEPPSWLIPVRHSLGASLMAVGRYPQAEEVYREDLARVPEDGWALFGLAQSLHMQGKHKLAMETDARFQKVWPDGGMKITSSCLCQPGPLK